MRKYKRVMSHDNEEWCKVWRKTNSFLLVPKMTWGIRRILMGAVATLKICTLICCLCQKHMAFQLKKYRRIIFHDTEKNPNFEKKLTFYLKNVIRNLVNFNASSGKSENMLFDRLLLQKVCNVWAKKYREVVSWKTTFGFKNDRSNLVNFHISSRK